MRQSLGSLSPSKTTRKVGRGQQPGQTLQDRKIINDPAGLESTQRPLPGALPRALRVSERPPRGASFPDRVIC